MSFQKGDKVFLKSGSPEMTVIRIIGETDGNKMDEVMRMRGFDDDDLLCEFINQKSKSERAAFKAIMVKSAHEIAPEEDDLLLEKENEEDDLDLDDFDF